MADQGSNEFRVLVAAPTRRDGEVTCELLGKEGIECTICNSIHDVAEELKAEVGAVVLTDAALTDPGMKQLVDSMQRQPPWSDIPTLLLTRQRTQLPSSSGSLGSLTNVTLLDRPASTRSMVSAVKAALRARERQYQIRDQLTAQQQAVAALRDADTRKDEFLATLAHELRNPLAAIRTGLEVVVRSPGEPQRTQRMVGMIDRQSRMLVKLIDDLMDVSRIATGKVVLQRDRIDLRAVLEAGLEGGQTVFDSSRHEIRLELPPGPVWIRGDSSRLAQVVGNLVNNACKYTPDGGRITVSLTQEDAAAVLSVADTGVGIPAEQLDQVFEMFAQVDRNLDRSRGGLGIGLSLVRRLVQLHGGTVEAHSEGIGKGSTFTVRLPTFVERPEDEDRADAQGTPRATRHLKILVIDDNQDVADGLATLLDDDGHEIRTAYSGAAGLEEVARFEPDIVFCDIGMPGMSGHEVARTLRGRQLAKAPFLIAVTGWGNDEDRRLSIDAGFDMHYTKPVSAEQVESVLARF